MENMFADVNTIYLFFVDNASTNTLVTRFIFTLLPPFPYSIIFANISVWTSYHYNAVKGKFVVVYFINILLQ